MSLRPRLRSSLRRPELLQLLLQDSLHASHVLTQLVRKTMWMPRKKRKVHGNSSLQLEKGSNNTSEAKRRTSIEFSLKVDVCMRVCVRACSRMDVGRPPKKSSAKWTNHVVSSWKADSTPEIYKNATLDQSSETCSAVVCLSCVLVFSKPPGRQSEHLRPGLTYACQEDDHVKMKRGTPRLMRLFPLRESLPVQNPSERQQTRSPCLRTPFNRSWLKAHATVRQAKAACRAWPTGRVWSPAGFPQFHCLWLLMKRSPLLEP